MGFKVFRVNECEWVCAKDIDSAIEWYENYTGEEVNVEEVEECDLEKDGQFIEFTDEKRIAELESRGLEESIIPFKGPFEFKDGQERAVEEHVKSDFGSLIKRGGEWWVKVPFKDILPTDENTEPFITASTEW